ncbi:MAG: autotransporter outer membrane beta-barrel domain-containing protein, partial [Planctomycetes bacterium]|nr:autotransporter outer membrane beta-barrel domain-containing protein [Planctomycetota bacterium]
SESRSFLDFVKEDAVGIEVGAYVSYRLTPEWSLFSSVLMGPRRADHEVVMFEGTSDAMLYSVSANAHGQYQWGERTYIRPSIGISYSYSEIDAYDLSGVFRGKYLDLAQDDVESDSGMMDAAVEFNWILQPEPDRVFMPFVEVGVDHMYLEPEAEAVRFQATGDAPRTVGKVRVGTRMLVSEKTQLDFNVGYRSIGVSDLDDWEVQLFFSHAF